MRHNPEGARRWTGDPRVCVQQPQLIRTLILIKTYTYNNHSFGISFSHSSEMLSNQSKGQHSRRRVILYYITCQLMYDWLTTDCIMHYALLSPDRRHREEQFVPFHLSSPNQLLESCTSKRQYHQNPLPQQPSREYPCSQWPN